MVWRQRNNTSHTNLVSKRPHKASWTALSRQHSHPSLPPRGRSLFPSKCGDSSGCLMAQWETDTFRFYCVGVCLLFHAINLLRWIWIMNVMLHASHHFRPLFLFYFLNFEFCFHFLLLLFSFLWGNNWNWFLLQSYSKCSKLTSTFAPIFLDIGKPWQYLFILFQFLGYYIWNNGKLNFCVNWT